MCVSMVGSQNRPAMNHASDRAGILKISASTIPSTGPRTGQYFHTGVDFRLRAIMSVGHKFGKKLFASGRSIKVITRNARRA